MTNDAILKQLCDIAAERLGVLDRALELARSLTGGPDDPKLEQLSDLIRSEDNRMSSIVEELERMLADAKAAPQPDDTGK